MGAVTIHYPAIHSGTCPAWLACLPFSSRFSCEMRYAYANPTSLILDQFHSSTQACGALACLSVLVLAFSASRHPKSSAVDRLTYHAAKLCFVWAGCEYGYVQARTFVAYEPESPFDDHHRKFVHNPMESSPSLVADLGYSLG